MSYRVQAHPDVVAALASARLPFEPRDWQKDFRSELADAIRALDADDGKWLRATYRSNDRAFSDVENCLLYNVGLSAFRRVAARRLQLERSFDAPDEHGFAHHYLYEVASKDAGPREWARTSTLGAWSFTFEKSWSSLKPHDAWLSAAACEVTHAPPTTPVTAIGVELCLRPPRRGNPGSLVNVLKPLLDGVLCAFHAHSGEALNEVVTRLTPKLDGHPACARLRALLTDERRAALGVRRLVWPYRQGVQWNPADDLCVWIDARVDEPIADRESACSGTIFECSPTARL